MHFGANYLHYVWHLFQSNNVVLKEPLQIIYFLILIGNNWVLLNILYCIGIHILVEFIIIRLISLS